MKRSVLVLVNLVILLLSVKAQEESYRQWSRRYGISKLQYNSTNQVKSLVQLSDSSTLVWGGTFDGNFWIFKTDEQGNKTWDKTYGPGSIYKLKKTSDGGFIAVGTVLQQNSNFYEDEKIIKTDSTGRVMWHKTFGGSDHDDANDVVQTPDGGFLVAGSTASKDGDVTHNHGNEDGWLLKLDSAGKLIWQKTYGGNDYDDVASIQPTGNGNYILAGRSFSNIPGAGKNIKGDFWVFVINDSGTVQWQKFYGGNKEDWAVVIKKTLDGGYIIGGNSFSTDDSLHFHGNIDIMVAKIDSVGNLKWIKDYGGGRLDYIYDILQTPDGDYDFAGNTSSSGGEVGVNKYGNYVIWFVQLSGTGRFKSQATYSEANNAALLAQTPDQGFVIGGSVNTYVNNYNGTVGTIIKYSPLNTGHNLVITNYDTVATCSINNYTTFRVYDSVPVTVNLYRFGKLYKIRDSVTEYVTFNDLKPGQYYATISKQSKVKSTSKFVNIVPEIHTAHVKSITQTKANVYLVKGIECATAYSLELKKINADDWSIRQENNNDPAAFYLTNLDPATTYLVRVGASITEDYITAVSKRYDSLTFTTLAASGDAATAEKLNVLSNNITILPNPVSSYFIINYNSATNKKANAILYDVNGKAVWTSGLVSTDAFISKKVITSQLPNGVYYLKLMDDAGTSINTKKIIISR